jgi:hypothetical protein
MFKVYLKCATFLEVSCFMLYTLFEVGLGMRKLYLLSKPTDDLRHLIGILSEEMVGTYWVGVFWKRKKV